MMARFLTLMLVTFGHGIAEETGRGSIVASGNFESIPPDTNKLFKTEVCDRKFPGNACPVNVTPGVGVSEISHQHTSRGGQTSTSQQAIDRLMNSWTDISAWRDTGVGSTKCERDFRLAINEFIENKYWALYLFDSWAKPGPSLYDGRHHFPGNYHQCRSAHAPQGDQTDSFGGRYCVVTLHNLSSTLSPEVYYLGHTSRMFFGICVPETCSQDHMTALFAKRIQLQNSAALISVLSTDCLTDAREYTTCTWAALLIILTIGTVCILGTVVDIMTVQRPQGNSASTTQPDRKSNLHGRIDSSETKVGHVKQSPVGHIGIWTRAVTSFSVYSNVRRLGNSSQSPGTISTISGLRSLTLTWILFTHTYVLLARHYGIHVARGVTAAQEYRLYDLMVNAPFGVDTFFTISGLMVSYHNIKHFMQQGRSYKWLYFYAHRYWRLTPPLLVILTMIQGLQRFLVSGAMAPTIQPSDKINCENHGWLFPLYAMNLRSKAIMEECMLQSWSLATDMQFYVVSPLMLLPFYYNKAAGFATCLLIIIGQIVLVGTNAYHYQWKISIDKAPLDWFSHFYLPFYTRISPFAIGILSGYLLVVNKGRVHMSRSIVTIGWVLSTSVVLGLMFGFHGDHTGDNPSSLIVTTLFYAFAKALWGACICWCIVACASGYGGPINAVLSWPPFVVLGRLTYVAYLAHMSVLAIIFENLEQPVHVNITTLVVFGTTGLICTCLVSAVITVCCEMPFLNLERVFYQRLAIEGTST